MIRVAGGRLTQVRCNWGGRGLDAKAARALVSAGPDASDLLGDGSPGGKTEGMRDFRVMKEADVAIAVRPPWL